LAPSASPVPAPTADPMRANPAAIREASAMPTTMMIPETIPFAKNSWLIPRRIALMPSSGFATDSVCSQTPAKPRPWLVR
jgi:hypothetical protein